MLLRAMPTDPARRAAAVTSDYEGLQGLCAVGVGMGLAVMVLPSQVWIGIILVCLGTIAGQGFYHSRYGRVRYRSEHGWLSLVGALGVVLVGGAGIAVDLFWRGPILLGALTVALGLLVMFALCYRHVGVTRVHVGVIAAVVVCALLPLVAPLRAVDGWRLDVIVLGAALIVIGFTDHVRLTRAMRPATDG